MNNFAKLLILSTIFPLTALAADSSGKKEIEKICQQLQEQAQITVRTPPPGCWKTGNGYNWQEGTFDTTLFHELKDVHQYFYSQYNEGKKSSSAKDGENDPVVAACRNVAQRVSDLQAEEDATIESCKAEGKLTAKASAKENKGQQALGTAARQYTATQELGDRCARRLHAFTGDYLGQRPKDQAEHDKQAESYYKIKDYWNKISGRYRNGGNQQLATIEQLKGEPGECGKQANAYAKFFKDSSAGLNAVFTRIESAQQAGIHKKEQFEKLAGFSHTVATPTYDYSKKLGEVDTSGVND